MEDYPKESKFKSKYDAVVKAKYPDATPSYHWSEGRS